jgi:hypothetical protein
VLAREGARGLTFRAVDAGAGVPVGTASPVLGELMRAPKATRHPELRASCAESVTESVRADLGQGMEFHRAEGLPGVGVPEGLVERIVATVVPERQVSRGARATSATSAGRPGGREDGR